MQAPSHLTRAPARPPARTVLGVSCCRRDHGYQNGQKGEWAKINNFELATRIPLYVVVPPSLRGSGAWGRGVVQTTIVESVDLYPTIADLAGLALPKMALGGESLRPLLVASASSSTPKAEGFEAETAGTQAHSGRSKYYAISQWPRRPSCVTRHSCLDGHGDPFTFTPDQAVMGYTLRVDGWRYTVSDPPRPC